MTARLDLDAIKGAHKLPDIVAGVTKLQRAGREWKACCPLHADRSPSFTIFAGGTRFQCFGCGAQGDVLDFVQQFHRVGLREAVQLLAGGSLPTIETAPLLPREGTSDRVEDARRIWRDSEPITGTPAEAYLRWRGINIAIPESLRFARLPYGPNGKVFPVMVAAIAGADNRLSGIQRTYLREDGRGKADVEKPKLSLGRVRCGAIRLAPAAGELIVCEGIEDGLSLVQVLGRAVWASAGTAMLPSMRFPSIVERVAIGGDNDEPGRRAAEKAAREFAARGVSVRTFFPIEAKDFNAELMEISA